MRAYFAAVLLAGVLLHLAGLFMPPALRLPRRYAKRRAVVLRIGRYVIGVDLRIAARKL